MPLPPRLLRPLASAQTLPANPFATLVTTRSTDNITGVARSTTGYIKVEWWDSTETVYGTGVPATFLNWSKPVGGAGEKTLRIYPSDASGNLSGALTYLDCNYNFLTSLDVSGLTALESLSVSGNTLASLDVSGLTALTDLNCGNTTLTSLDFSGCTAMQTLYCGGNLFASLDVSGLTALIDLSCDYNSLISLDLSGLTALQRVYCPFGSLTSLDVSGCTSLSNLNCLGNSLTSLRAQNVSFTGGSYFHSYYAYNGVTARDNNLSSAALDQFYTDLAPGDSPLLVYNNPGTTGDDPTIATTKGYTVYGS